MQPQTKPHTIELTPNAPTDAGMQPTFGRSNKTPKGRTTIAAIRRRLEKLELEHLRNHAAELANKLERIQADLEYAEFAAISWRDDCLRMMEESLPEGGVIGLAKDGSLHVVKESDSKTQIPRIGTFWKEQGGIYAGVMRGIDGAPDYYLIVADLDAKNITWDQANKFATDLSCEGHADFALPTRKEQSVLFGNVPELFEKEWYWSGEQHAGSSDYAWSQIFLNGYQYDYYDKGNELRARAVRRLVIQ